MLQLMSKFKLNASVLAIGQGENSVVVLDSNYHLYELRDGEFIFAKRILEQSAHQFAKSCAICLNGIFAFGIPKSRNLEIYSIKNGVLAHLKTLLWHKSDIYNVRFSRDGKYLVSGGEDGKVFVYGLPHFDILNILPPRPDYISNIHFGKISKLLVYSSYDLVNCVFDMNYNEVIGEFETNAVAEDMTFFDNDRKIFFICSNGECGIYDVENKTLDLKKNFDAWLTRVGLTKDDNYAYIGTRSGELHYLNLARNASEYKVDLKNESGIASMKIINAKLFIGFSDGNLHIYDLARFEDDFELAIASDDFNKAYEISAKNIALKTHKIYIDLRTESFEAEFSKASKILDENQTSANFLRAASDLENFFEDVKLKEIFDNYTKNFGVVKDFIEAINKMDYKNAYNLANENAFLKRTQDFIALENKFELLFNQAKEMLSLDIHNPKARDLLKPFASVVGKKEAINVLFVNADKFIQADKLLKNKQFGEYFKLAQSFKALEATSAYKKTLIFGEQILATINELEGKGNTKKALELLELLAKFSPFGEIAKSKKDYINLKLEFLDKSSKGDFIGIMQNIEKYAALKGSMEYINCLNKINDIFDSALNFANKGDVEACYKYLEKYIPIAHLKNKMDGIFNIAYLNEINKHLDSPKVVWSASLERYVAMFGKSDEIIEICSKSDEIVNILNKIEINRGEIEYAKSILILKDLA